MTLAKRLGGCDHNFTGKSKWGTLYRIPCEFVEVMYRPYDFYHSFDEERYGIENRPCRTTTSIWVPKQYLDEIDLELFERQFKLKAA